MPNPNPKNLTKYHAVKGGRAKLAKTRLQRGWPVKGLEEHILSIGGVGEYFKALYKRNPQQFDKMVEKLIVATVKVKGDVDAVVEIFHKYGGNNGK